MSTDPIALTPGVVDTNDYGNKFNGTQNTDGIVNFVFDSTDTDLNLTLFGYDIDTDDEVEVLLNDVSIGFLSAGPNNDLQAQNFLIAAADMLEGENTISFTQNHKNTFKWGVTNVKLDAADAEEPVDTPVADLALGVADTGTYGNRYNGERDLDGLVSYTFDSIGEDIVLTFDGFDFDNDGEVELYLNGTLVGAIDAGANNRLKGYSYEFAADELADGQNTITFKQAENTNFAWGVTNVMFDRPEEEEVIVDTPVANLALGVADTDVYGNRFNSLEDDDGLISYAFDSIGEDIVLTFDGYDFDQAGEVELYLNGSLVGTVGAGGNNRWGSFSQEFAAGDLLDGQNVVTFKQAENVNFAWGVTNVKFDRPEEEEVVVDTPVADLALGVANTDVYGNRFNNLTDEDGLISYTFDSIGEDIVLTFDGYDFDSDSEIELYLNDTLVGTVDAGGNNRWGSFSQEFAAEDLADGQNTITFKQAEDVRFAWGVTNVMFDRPEAEEVEVDTPVADLALGVTDTDVYGNRFNGLSDDDGLISYTFDSTGEDMVLNFKGYDVDQDGEVEVYLNDVLVAPVEAGANNGFTEYSHTFAAGDLADGENTITFKQATKVSFVWGVSDVSVHSTGDDVIEGDANDNVLIGGEGNDVFVFGQGGGQDVIEDFELANDTITLENAGVIGFLGLNINNDEDGNAEVDLNGFDTLTLEGVDAADLNAGHFDFV